MVIAQIEPQLPNTSEVITCFPDTTGYDVFTVGPFGRDFSDLQIAINAVIPGTVLILDAGVTFNGGFNLPDKGQGDKWIVLMSSRMDLLPRDKKRLNPTAPTGNPDYPFQSDAMPKIITDHLSGIPCFRTKANAHHYRLVGLEVTADTDVINSYGLINLGDGSSAQNSLEVIPHHFVIDRCFIHGHDNATIMKYGVRLDCSNAAIIDSYISGFHSIGFDAQAISGINGPGPFKIINNYLEASGENILFGGGAPAIPGLVPSDIEIRKNYLYKPWSWRVGHPDYAGKHWTIKNLFELKTGKRVLFDGNILENSWADLPIGQSGYAILLTVRTENGNAPQADVSDVLISNNIIRHTGAGISLSGSDDGAGNRSSRIKIFNNLFEDINGPAYGDQNIAGPNDGTFLKIGEPEDVWVDHNTVLQTGPITWAYGITDGFVYTNNLSNSFISAGGYQGIYGPGQTQGNGTFEFYFPDVTDANMHFHKNVLIGGNADRYTDFNITSQNYFPSGHDDVVFEDFPNGAMDYHGYSLSTASPFYQNASDSKDIGVDFQLLDSAMIRDINCPVVITTIKKVVADISTSFELFPNPVSEVLNVNFDESIDKYFIIRDIVNRKILEGKITGNSAEINIGKLSPGIYAISFIIDKHMTGKLFSVQ